jgi:cytochrome c biogenesis factor
MLFLKVPLDRYSGVYRTDVWRFCRNAALALNDLQSENQLTSLFSRESVFLFNNLIFISLFIVCFWGVVYPVISDVLPVRR